MKSAWRGFSAKSNYGLGGSLHPAVLRSVRERVLVALVLVPRLQQRVALRHLVPLVLRSGPQGLRWGLSRA